MSADAAPATWTLTLPCTRAEAEAIGHAELDGAVLMVSEVDEAADEWRLDAYFAGEPAREMVAQVRELAASGGWSRAQPQPLAEQDWVALSQAGLEPIREGRFVVHTSAHAHAADTPGARAFLIEAGQAFGTGHHATTAGCLAMLDRLADRAVANAIDLGTGTGLLAFAARHLWPEARVTATDIDPVAIAVTGENAAANGVVRVDLLVADGARAPAIAAAAPYDLVVANILAGPLIAMAPEIAAIAAPNAAILLAGLLTRQADDVLAAYAAQGCVETEREERGDWTILLMAAGGAPEHRRPATAGDRDGWTRDT